MNDEMPPQWKWPFEDELSLHFERVQAARDAKYGGNSGGEEDEGGIQNEYAERFK